MKHILVVLGFVSVLIAFSVAHADTPTFDNLSDEDFKNISEDFSGLFVHTSASPPTSLGKIFGIELGVIAGASEIPGVEAVSKRYDPNIDVPYGPFATVYGAVSVPLGFTIEANLLPDTEVENFDLGHMSLGVKWTATDVFFDVLPFDLAIRAFYSRSEISFDQTVSNGGPPITVNVDFENKMHGAEVLLGWNLFLIQPYLGGGFVNSSSDLQGIATADPSYSLFVDNVSQSKTTSVSSARWIAGLQLNLALLKTSLEYNNIFGNDRLALKLSVGF